MESDGHLLTARSISVTGYSVIAKVVNLRDVHTPIRTFVIAWTSVLFTSPLRERFRVNSNREQSSQDSSLLRFIWTEIRHASLLGNRASKSGILSLSPMSFNTTNRTVVFSWSQLLMHGFKREREHAYRADAMWLSTAA